MDRHVHSNCSFFGILFHVHSNNTWYRKTCNRAWLFQRYSSLSWRRRIPFHRTSKQLLTGHSGSWIGEKDSNNRYASLKWSILQNNLLTWICRTATNQKASPRTRRYFQRSGKLLVKRLGLYTHNFLKSSRSFAQVFQSLGLWCRSRNGFRKHHFKDKSCMLT